MRSNRIALAYVIAGSLLLSACGHDGDLGKPPPRSDSPIEYKPELSTFTVPLTVNADVVRAELEQAIPRNLYTLNQHVSNCVPSQKVKVFGAKIPVSPRLACDVAINVTRGPLTLTGRGSQLVVTVPIKAHAEASHVAGVIHESANGAAIARVTAQLNIAPNWAVSGKLGLSYDWTKPPTVRFLGHDFTFADQVDAKLRPIIAQVQQQLPAQLAKINLAAQVGDIWRQGFAVITLNGEKPPVWMRITPSKVMFGGYSVNGPIATLALGVEGTTETFVGEKPDPKPPTSLPNFSKLPVTPGKTSMFVPVVATYDQVEPVILKALVKRSAQPFVVPKLGPLMARFEKVQAYGTDGGNVAVGLTLSVWPQSKPGSVTSGTVWLTGGLVNPVNTRELTFKNLHVNGATDGKVANLILQVCNNPAIADAIAKALSQNFEKDYQKLQVIIDKAIANVPVGGLVLSAKIDTMRSGSLSAAGQGLYLPVWAEGQTSLRVKPKS